MKPALEKPFVWVKLDLLEKTRFGVGKLEFFRVQCESYDQTLAARGSQGHYLNSLGTDFSYHFYFLKKKFFSTPMPSKSQNYVEIAYKMLEKKIFWDAKFQSSQNRSRCW